MKFNTSSLRLRFISATAVWIVICLLLTGALVSKLVRDYVIDGFHEEMEIHIEELAALTSTDDNGQPYMLRRLSDPRFIPKGSGFYWQVNRYGFNTVRSPSLGDGNLLSSLATSSTPAWRIVKGTNGDMLEYAMLRFPQKGKPPLRLLIATDKRMMDEVLAQIDWPIIYSLSGFAIVMVALGALQINYSLNPIKRMERAISDIRLGKEANMLGQYPSEIAPLVTDLNQLLDANTEMVQSARVQAGNLAHGLRTPLAVMLDEAQQVAINGDEKSAKVFLDGCQQMQRYIDYYTTRARMAALAKLPGQRASIEQTITPVITAMRRLYRDKSLSICIGKFPDQQVQVEQVDLEEMTSNLIDNACKWARSRVMISWEKNGDHTNILIDDDGVGIEPHQYEKVFGVGERLDRSEIGTGLGLSIVRDLALHYRGSIMLADSPLGGLRAMLMVPLVNDHPAT
jgi:signal transduction histidine kinase